MVPLGTTAPDFALPDSQGNTVSLADFADKDVLIVAFICNHCPYVKLMKSALVEFVNDYAAAPVAFVAISANDAEKYPQDGPEEMAKDAREFQYPFPYLYDASQETAKAYRAACTPDFYVFDAERRLVYRGQFDDARPGAGVKSTGKDLREAVDALLEGRPINSTQRASIGCNIKWKPGSAPDYFG